MPTRADSVSFSVVRHDDDGRLHDDRDVQAAAAGERQISHSEVVPAAVQANVLLGLVPSPRKCMFAGTATQALGGQEDLLHS